MEMSHTNSREVIWCKRFRQLKRKVAYEMKILNKKVFYRKDHVRL